MWVTQFNSKLLWLTPIGPLEALSQDIIKEYAPYDSSIKSSKLNFPFHDCRPLEGRIRKQFLTEKTYCFETAIDIHDPNNVIVPAVDFNIEMTPEVVVVPSIPYKKETYAYIIIIRYNDKYYISNIPLLSSKKELKKTNNLRSEEHWLESRFARLYCAEEVELSINGPKFSSQKKIDNPFCLFIREELSSAFPSNIDYIYRDLLKFKWSMNITFNRKYIFEQLNKVNVLASDGFLEKYDHKSNPTCCLEIPHQGRYHDQFVFPNGELIRSVLNNWRS